MRVLQINSVCGVGSTGRVARELSDILVEKGAESAICYGRGDADTAANTFKISSDWDNKNHGLWTRITDRHGFGSKKETKKLIQYIESFQPDIIHLHNLHGYYVNLECLFRYLHQINKPIVWTLHDCWTFTGHCAHFDYIGCNRWKTGCYDCPQKKEYPASYFLDNSKENYERKKALYAFLPNLYIVVPSIWMQKQVEASFLKRNSIQCIYNGIDVKLFKPVKSDIWETKYNLSEKKIILGVSSVWNGKKGFNDFISLSNKLSSEYKIVLVGLEKNQMKQLPEGIIGLPRAETQKVLVEMYSNADVFVNLSKEEAFGLVTVEAMACGTPVVAYNTTATPELVTSDCGIIVSDGDIDAVKTAIDTLLEKGKRSYAEACRQNVVDRFDKQETYSQYLELYSECLKE